MIFTADFKKGLHIEVDGTPYQIVEFQHVKPGKGNAFVRTRLKNMLNESVIEKTFKSGEKVEEPDLELKRMQFLYSDKEGFHFMDLSSYEQTALNEETVGDSRLYLTDNLEVDVRFYRGRAVAIELPIFVELKVGYTEPGIKGDTASGGGKPAEMETGLKLTVPFHIKQGETLKVDTRTGAYVEKIK